MRRGVVLALLLSACASKPNFRGEVVGPPPYDPCRGDSACTYYWCPQHPCKTG